MDSNLIIILLAIVTITALYLLFKIGKYKLIIKNNKTEWQSLNNKYSKLISEKNKGEQIFQSIDNAFYCISNDSLDDFNIKMNELANSFKNVFDSEYCAIGRIYNNGKKNLYKDIAINFSEKDTQAEIDEQYIAIKQVIIGDLDDPGYFLSNALKRKESIVYFDKYQIYSRKNRNQNFEIYENKILKSKTIKNTTIINIVSNNQTIGYIQFINTNKRIIEDDFLPYIASMFQLIQFATYQEENKEKLNEKALLGKDIEFITNLIGKIDNADILLKQIMNYFILEFGASIVTFRIPILNGKAGNVLYYLRELLISDSINISDKQEITNQYNNSKVIVEQSFGSNNLLKCHLTDEFIFGEFSDNKLKNLQDANINNDECIIIPILKDVNNKNCFKGNSTFCKLNEGQNCTEKFINLSGIFRVRVFNGTDIHNEFYNRRLKSFSSMINFLFDSLLYKYDSKKTKIFQEQIEKIDFKNISNFDSVIAGIIKSSVGSKVCTIYKVKTNNSIVSFQISATTTEKFLNIESGKIVESINLINDFEYLNDTSNIISNTYILGRSKYLYNMLDPHNNNLYYLRNYFREFIELPNDLFNSDDLVKDIQNESLFVIPIKNKNKSITGLILLIGKEKNDLNISTSYCENDRVFIELVTTVISRFYDAYNADQEREKFLDQLGHELLAPITEIIYENNSLNRRYERDRLISKEIALNQIKENLNAANYFKHILDDIEFGYSHLLENNYNIEFFEKPKDIILWVVKMFEKRAHAEKQIEIRTNITEMPPMFLDKNRIQQVFINLIKNAIQYSNPYTKIEIYYKTIEINLNNEGMKRWHEIIFVNEGIGFIEADKDRIFDLYTRSRNAINVRASGTGIGLYIVKKIMNAHHGDCKIKKYDNPTEIAIYLPHN